MADRTTLAPQLKDLGGGLRVRRLLPSADCRSIGPFVFFDHFGPITAKPDDQHDVRPHPHIGLATVTYLFEGAMMHRDSTGVVQRIESGAVNWMTAGRGIVHSERTPKDLAGTERRSHGLQLWAALPAEHEEDAPRFQHVPAAAIPERREAGLTIRLLVGSGLGGASPVQTASPTLYVDLAFDFASGAEYVVPAAAPERALYAVDEDVELDGELCAAHTMVVLREGETPTLTAPRGARVVLIGGEPLGHRYLSWNFVSSRKERILQAEADWAAQRFDPVPGETEFIPLPQRHA